MTTIGLRTAAVRVYNCRRYLKVQISPDAKILHAPPPLISRCEARLNLNRRRIRDAASAGLAALCAVSGSCRIRFDLSRYFRTFENMEAVLIKADKKSDVSLLISLAKKLGMNAKSLSKSELEDWNLAQMIDAGMKSGSVSRKAVMKKLGR